MIGPHSLRRLKKTLVLKERVVGIYLLSEINSTKKLELDRKKLMKLISFASYFLRALWLSKSEASLKRSDELD